MENAKQAFEKSIKDKQRSVGWFRADIEKYPELNTYKVNDTDQVVMSTQYGLHR